MGRQKIDDYREYLFKLAERVKDPSLKARLYKLVLMIEWDERGKVISSLNALRASMRDEGEGTLEDKFDEIYKYLVRRWDYGR